MLPERKTGLLLALLILVLPALFFDWLLPFVSNTTLGNDYATFSIPQQLELQFSLANGSFPLFVPGFAGGRTAQAMVQGQLFHPISLVASHLPGYWSGYALQWNTLLRLLSLGLAHLAIFAFLRKLSLGRGFAFLLAMVTAYNMRMLDLFRYGAALESWTGHLFLCAAIGVYFLERSSLGARAGIIAATYWLVTSGHPQMAYYGGVSAVLFTLLVPFIAAAIDRDGRGRVGAPTLPPPKPSRDVPQPAKPAGSTRDPRRREALPGLARFWAATAGLFALGLLLSAAFIVPFTSEFFAGNPRSAAGQSFTWALAWADSLPGTLNNLFLPLRADVHGAFGGSSLVVVAALLPVLFLLRTRIPAGIWAAWGLAVVVFLALQGDRTPVYRALWQYFPLLGSMRAPGRLSLLLPILMMCALAWQLCHVERSARTAESGPRRELPTLLGLGGLVTSAAYLASMSRVDTPPSDYSPVSINRISSLTEMAAVGLGLLTLLCFALLVRLPRWRRGLVAAICVSTCLQCKLVLDHGTWKEVAGRTPTFAELANWKREKLGYRFPSGEDVYDTTMWRQASKFHVEPALGRVYFQWRPARDLEDAYRIIDEGVGPGEVIVEESDRTLVPAASGADTPTAKTRLVESSLNRLVFDVEASRPGYFTLAYPYTGRWTALVNGMPVPPRRANGGNHAIPIPPGHSTVEVRYRSPAQLAGWALSGLGLVLATFLLLYPTVGGKRAITGALVIAAASAGMYALLVRSLYTGRDLGTAYAWAGPQPPGPLPDLAYGRKTNMSSTFHLRHNCCPFVGSKGTDGDRTRLTGFMTEEEDAPVWGVDLGRERAIGRVVAFESRRGPGWNLRPLILATSRDGQAWSRASENFTQTESTLTLDFAAPVTARFVAVRASGRCRLSLDEVEVFPPKE